MDWENERYVRLYTRDTADLLAVGHEGRLVLYELMRKVDRAGVLDTDDPEVIANLIRVPLEVAAAGLQRLLERGTVELGDVGGRRCLILPNFIEAQEAKASSKQRQKESRARRRARARREAESQGSHTASQSVTPSLATPSLAEPNPPSTPHEPERDPVADAVGTFNRLFERKFKPGTYADLCKKAFKAGYTAEQLKAAAWAAQNQCADSPEVLANFTPKSVWRLKSRDCKTTLQEWLDQAEELWPKRYGSKPMPWRDA